MASGAQRCAARRTIKTDFWRGVAAVAARAGRSLVEAQRAVGETDARPCKRAHDGGDRALALKQAFFLWLTDAVSWKSKSSRLLSGSVRAD